MKYHSGVIKRWITFDTLNVLVDLGFNIFSEQRFRLAGLGQTDIAQIDTQVFLENVQKIAPVNTRVSIECFGRDENFNWLGNIILPDGQLINDIVSQEYFSNFIKSHR